jgi:phage baseplate assembly protein W
MPSNASQPNASRRHLGKGWSFPIRLDGRGRFALSEGQRDVQEAIKIVLGTRVGERIMRPTFGSEVSGLLFEPATPGTAARLADAIKDSLSQWEPRIDVLQVTVDRDAEVETRFVASLTYRIRENNSVLNEVFPFYLTEGTEEA